MPIHGSHPLNPGVARRGRRGGLRSSSVGLDSRRGVGRRALERCLLIPERWGGARVALIAGSGMCFVSRTFASDCGALSSLLIGRGWSTHRSS